MYCKDSNDTMSFKEQNLKANFKCVYCRKPLEVGKRLHAEYTCPNCHGQMLISRDEKAQGHVNYKKNFFKQK